MKSYTLVALAPVALLGLSGCEREDRAAPAGQQPGSDKVRG